MPEEIEINVEDTDVSNKIDRSPFVLIATISIFAILIFLLLVISQRERNDISQEEKTTPKNVLVSEDSFKKTTLSAKAAYVFDTHTEKILYAYNEEVQLPLASITKLMTAVVVSEELQSDKDIFVTNRDITTEGDSGLLANEKWKIENLVGFTLMTSSNDGAQALANAAMALSHNISGNAESNFTDLMNQKAREIGLPQTYFLNSTGLDTTGQISGGYGSAKDTVSLLHYALIKDSSLLEPTAKSTKDYYSDAAKHVAKNTNQVIDSIPGLIASKTGFTDLAGGNLVIAFDAGINRPVLIAVLGSTQEGRFNDIEQLVNATLQNLSVQKSIYTVNKN